MTDIESVNRDLRSILFRSKAKQKKIIIDAFNNIRTCHGSHSALTQAVRGKKFWYDRMTYFYQIVLAFISLILVFAVYGIWFLRSYNRANTFGGCFLNFLWPFDECPIAY